MSVVPSSRYTEPGSGPVTMVRVARSQTGGAASISSSVGGGSLELRAAGGSVASIVIANGFGGSARIHEWVAPLAGEDLPGENGGSPRHLKGRTKSGPTLADTELSEISPELSARRRRGGASR